MSAMFFQLKKYSAVTLLTLNVTNVYAGAYIFADEVNGINLVTHPSTYTGANGPITVRVCIDPGSPNAADMEYAVQNNVAEFNQLIPTTDNVKLGGSNNVPSNAIDFESVALHEIGHCLGMAHINAASESGETGNNQNYTKATDGVNNAFDLNAGVDGVIGSSDDVRGDDVNLLWFRKSNNDPFTIDSVIDSTTYSRDVADLPAGHNFAANADRAVSNLLGHGSTEAVMQQVTFFDEAQRTLGHDDVATLRYAASGVNETESDGKNPNAQDNYTTTLEYGGISSSTNCDVNLSFTDTTGLAFCSVGGAFVGTNHLSVRSASIEFGQGFNWFFNSSNTAPVLSAIGNQILTEGDTLVVSISATDTEGDALSFSALELPSYASLVDNNNGTATLTINPIIGDAALTSVTLAVTDDGDPIMSDEEIFEINVVALDTDSDGITDYDEINVYGTLAIEADTDGDGLDDYQEIFVYLTSAIDADTDGDFINDGIEVSYGSDPSDDLVWPNIADGDIAPLGSPDGVINAADYLIAQRIVLGDLNATSLELSHADLYPAGSPDGVINTSDLILLLKLLQ